MPTNPAPRPGRVSREEQSVRLPRVVAVGAFERDNFGDLLYAELARAVGGDRCDLTLASPIAADMRADLGVKVPAVAQILREEGAEGIWVVGGEVGATTPEYVFATRFGDDALAALREQSAEDRTATLSKALGGVTYAAPYIPKPSALSRTSDAPLVMTSIGLAGVGNAPATRMQEITDTLREARYLSVRDPRSSEVLTTLGLDHQLDPDFAHAVSRQYTPRPTDGEYVLLHLPQAVVTKEGLEAWLEVAVGVARLTRLEVRFFLAGTAPGHDSIDTASRLADHCRALGLPASISTARSVFPRIDEIAGARLWVGGSLHGRIISQSYNVPRVSFRKPKVDAYASHWDSRMPYGVDSSDVLEAVTAALKVDVDPRTAEVLSDAAIQSAERALETLREHAATADHS